MDYAQITIHDYHIIFGFYNLVLITLTTCPSTQTRGRVLKSESRTLNHEFPFYSFLALDPKPRGSFLQSQLVSTMFVRLLRVTHLISSMRSRCSDDTVEQIRSALLC